MTSSPSIHLLLLLCSKVMLYIYILVQTVGDFFFLHVGLKELEKLYVYVLGMYVCARPCMRTCAHMHSTTAKFMQLFKHLNFSIQ